MTKNSISPSIEFVRWRGMMEMTCVLDRKAVGCKGLLRVGDLVLSQAEDLYKDQVNRTLLLSLYILWLSCGLHVAD